MVRFSKFQIFIRLNVISAIQSNGFALRAIVGLLLHDIAALLSVTLKRPCTINSQLDYHTHSGLGGGGGGREGGYSLPKFWATQIFLGNKRNLGKFLKVFYELI